MLGSILNFVCSIGTIVFCGLALVAVRKEKELKYLPQCYPNECFSKTERIINISCIMGLSILVAVLASVSIIFGLQAVFRLEKDRKHMRRNTAVASYTNPIALATTDRY
ncbi:hypothetical protein DdX_08076 [Ditylenchus destructor]|uniref:Uncharacterized protein n=1 Tax=Ditylenchus destructor TaxID=166010 RepID=A0AAD4R4T5_9BILA|nr:hypothetical protein DdX_08076 [Ditylenchus destructor]